MLFKIFFLLLLLLILYFKLIKHMSWYGLEIHSSKIGIANPDQ